MKLKSPKIQERPATVSKSWFLYKKKCIPRTLDQMEEDSGTHKRNEQLRSYHASEHVSGQATILSKKDMLLNNDEKQAHALQI